LANPNSNPNPNPNPAYYSCKTRRMVNIINWLSIVFFISVLSIVSSLSNSYPQPPQSSESIKYSQSLRTVRPTNSSNGHLQGNGQHLTSYSSLYHNQGDDKLYSLDTHYARRYEQLHPAFTESTPIIPAHVHNVKKFLEEHRRKVYVSDDSIIDSYKQVSDANDVGRESLKTVINAIYYDIVLESNQSSGNTYTSDGYISLLLYQNSESCGGGSDLIEVVELGSCFVQVNDTSNYLDDITYSTWQMKVQNYTTDIIILQTNHNDITCSTETGSTIISLSTTCQYVDDSTIPTSFVYNYSTSTSTFSGYGTVLSYFGADGTCKSSASQYLWHSESFCKTLRPNLSSRTYCSDSYDYQKTSIDFYPNANCSGSPTTSDNYDETSCDEGYGGDYYSNVCYGYTPVECVNASDLVYNSDGEVSIMGTFQKCLENIGGDGVFYPGIIFTFTPIKSL